MTPERNDLWIMRICAGLELGLGCPVAAVRLEVKILRESGEIKKIYGVTR